MNRAAHHLTTLLGIRHPIVQAPMVGVSTPRLAAEVSNAGALGSIGVGASTPAQARDMIAQTRALTAAPFNVNLFCHAPAVRDAAREQAWLRHLAPLFAQAGGTPPAALGEIYRTFVADEAMLAVLLAARPAVVSFHFGLPAQPQLHALRQAGIRTMATATNLAEAAAIDAAGIDVIVAQGIEAGGHRGMFDPAADDQRLPTATLVRLLARQSRRPVLAAGGIMDGPGIQAALDSGAAGAQLGTAFILCPESAASAGHRAALQDERAAHTVLTAVLSGRPARGLANRLVAHGEAAGSPAPADYPVAYDATKQLNALAARHGVEDFAVHWAGQAAALARAMPAAQLLRTLLAERQAVLDARAPAAA
ncbi:NAD(P)H-dependent flavin oxidoreductase [Pseudorhodoferax sp.]|uniref:NAD(P)H-dependent flavin oxidoreductase n=1 Tax=Pseudorhodoferax sp. TaxID=1993553 RepID=UPI002DD69042|nr:nitronate monooxygenase [Pseudorhodoferax sp.]